MLTTSSIGDVIQVYKLYNFGADALSSLAWMFENEWKKLLYTNEVIIIIRYHARHF